MKPQHVAVIFGKLDALDPNGAQVIALVNGLAEHGHRVTLLASTAIDLNLRDTVTLRVHDRQTKFGWFNLIRYRRWVIRQLNELNADQTISLRSTLPGQIMVPTTGLSRPRLDAAIDQDVAINVRARHALARLLPSAVLRQNFERRSLMSDSLRAVIAQTPQLEAELQAFGLKPQVEIHPAAMPLPQTAISDDAASTLRGQLARAFGLSPDAYWVCHAFETAGLGGLEVMLRAFKPLVDQGVDAQLLLAGPARYTHLAWIAELGLRDRVRFVGKTTQAAELMAACDLIVSPTRYDPAGWAIMDALRTDTPVITTEACGLAGSIRQRGAPSCLRQPSPRTCWTRSAPATPPGLVAKSPPRWHPTPRASVDRSWRPLRPNGPLNQPPRAESRAPHDRACIPASDHLNCPARYCPD